jgi:monofunctional glycosyltransferase
VARRGKRSHRKTRESRSIIGGIILTIVAIPITYLGFCTMLLAAYIVVPPPVTGVQIQRAVEAIFEDEPFRHNYRPVGAAALSPHLRNAVVAAEDGRFYQHRGLDPDAIRQAYEETRSGRRVRGGSTITQQLVKNLFMTTHRSMIRKAFEVPLALVAEVLLSKDRILTLYLNVVEWDRGVYGAEAAARHYYTSSAASLSRQQSAALAACLPNPRQRNPQSMGWYTNIILRRMGQMGW